jgi:hypothetical protein
MSNQLDGIEPNDIIKKVTGKITKLYKSRNVNTKYGEKNFQDGEIEIDGNAYKITFCNNEQNDSVRNRTVTLSSTRGKQGLNGVTFAEEKYENKEGQQIHNQVIKVSASAKVQYDGASEEPPRAASVEEAVASLRRGICSKSIVTDNPEKALDEIVELHQYIDSLVRMAYLGKITDEETLRSYVSSVFIEANRKGIHYSSKVEAPKKEEAKEELNPDDWGSAIVPSGSHKGKKLAEIGKPALRKLYEYYLEKGFTTPFAKCVEKAAEDLNLDPVVEEADDIPF